MRSARLYIPPALILRLVSAHRPRAGRRGSANGWASGAPCACMRAALQAHRACAMCIPRAPRSPARCKCALIWRITHQTNTKQGRQVYLAPASTSLCCGRARTCANGTIEVRMPPKEGKAAARHLGLSQRYTSQASGKLSMAPKREKGQVSHLVLTPALAGGGVVLVVVVFSARSHPTSVPH